MKRLVSGFYRARSIASTMLVLGLVLGVLVTPQPAGALDQSTTGKASKTGGFVATRVDAAGVGAQVASLVARSVSNVLLRDVVAATMGLFNTKTPAGFVTRLTTPTAGDISTTTEVDNKMGYLPGDTVTITVTVSAASVANGGKAARVRKTAENVSVYVLLPQADEGFV
ncbi:hypothetical protein KJY78_02180, partial [Canibacter sp. lx-45]|uniref:hypothetical protein n=1 Tax=Canibacter zhuwentaonis TaxID=2837491 RepID=UPI001BDC48AE